MIVYCSQVASSIEGGGSVVKVYNMKFNTMNMCQNKSNKLDKKRVE